MIFKQLEVVEDDALHRTLNKKMAPPLVTLLSAEPEIQYVALRNINLIVQKYPTILAHEVKVRWKAIGDQQQMLHLSEGEAPPVRVTQHQLWGEVRLRICITGSGPRPAET